MADKLPPVFVPLEAIELIRDKRGARGIGDSTENSVTTIDLLHLERQGFVRYEPAVPRCRTCPRNGLGTCFMFGALISDDDYCSNHPEART